MKERCYSKGHKSYASYGGRGISVCDEWRNSSRAFINWGEENGFEPHLQLDRIDNDGNYEPSNCRWVTRKTNASNTRRQKPLPVDTLIAFKHAIESGGKIVSIAKELGIPYQKAHDIMRSERYRKLKIPGHTSVPDEPTRRVGIILPVRVVHKIIHDPRFAAYKRGSVYDAIFYAGMKSMGIDS
jgi:hypothetical protein